MFKEVCVNIAWFHKVSILPPWKIIGNHRGRGVSKAKMLEEKYEARLEFPVVVVGGGGGG